LTQQIELDRVIAAEEEANERWGWRMGKATTTHTTTTKQ
jgi:hypothetical protein